MWVARLDKATVVHAGDVPVGPKLNPRVRWPSSLRNRFFGARGSPRPHRKIEFFVLENI